MIINITDAVAELMKNDCIECNIICDVNRENECWKKMEKILIDIIQLRRSLNA